MPTSPELISLKVTASVLRKPAKNLLDRDLDGVTAEPQNTQATFLEGTGPGPTEAEDEGCRELKKGHQT